MKLAEQQDALELVTGGDVGRRLGVSRQRVSQLADQPGFPAPLGLLGRSKVYRWSDVEAWAAERGRALTDKPV